MFSVPRQSRRIRRSVPGSCFARLAIAFAVLSGGFIQSVSASIIFSDNFNSEPGSGDGTSGESGLNYNAFANWTITDGNVDLIAQGDFAPGPGIRCFDDIGKCVDLDGSNGPDAGIMTSTVALPLGPGQYSISYALAGVDPGFTQPAAAIANTVDIAVQSVGGGTILFSDVQVREQGDVFSFAGGSFAVTAPTPVEIVFQDRGNDFFGAVLDNVTLSRVPVPGTLVLLGSALCLVGAGRVLNRRLPKREPR